MSGFIQTTDEKIELEEGEAICLTAKWRQNSKLSSFKEHDLNHSTFDSTLGIFANPGIIQIDFKKTQQEKRENDITEDCVRTALRHSYIIISGAACLTCSFLPTVQPICYHCEKIQIWDRIARLNTNAQLLNLNSRYSTIFF